MKKYLVFLTVVLINTATIYAGLTVSPPRQEITILPGETCQGSYKVTSTYDVPVNIKVEYRNWFLLPEDKNRGLDVSDWLSVSPSEFTLKSKESKTVDYTVKLSTYASGVIVGMVSFVPDSPTERNVTLVVSVAVFATARGTEKIDWKVSKVKFEGASKNLQVTATVENHGNVHIRPSGFVKILSDNKKNKMKDMGVLEFKEGRPVYPGSYRSYVARGSLALPKGKYTALVHITGLREEKEQEIAFKVNKSGELIFK